MKRKAVAGLGVVILLAGVAVAPRARSWCGRKRRGSAGLGGRVACDTRPFVDVLEAYNRWHLAESRWDREVGRAGEDELRPGRRYVTEERVEQVTEADLAEFALDSLRRDVEPLADEIPVDPAAALKLRRAVLDYQEAIRRAFHLFARSAADVFETQQAWRRAGDEVEIAAEQLQAECRTCAGTAQRMPLLCRVDLGEVP